MNMDRSIETDYIFHCIHPAITENGRRQTGIGPQRGLTLPETLITLATASLLLGFAAPKLHDFVLNNRMVSEVNSLVATLQITRSEATKRGQTATLCPSSDGKTCIGAASDYTWWHTGALMFVDSNDNNQVDDGEPIVLVHQKAGGGLTIKTSKVRPRIEYQPNGFSSGTNATFAFCDTRGTASVRYVTVSNTGRPRISRTSTSDLNCP